MQKRASVFGPIANLCFARPIRLLLAPLAVAMVHTSAWPQQSTAPSSQATGATPQPPSPGGSSSTQSGLSAEALARAYIGLGEAADDIGDQIATLTQRKYVLYDARIGSDLVVLRAFAAQLAAYEDRYKEFKPTRIPADIAGNSTFGDVGTLITALTGAFAVPNAQISYGPAISDGESFIVSRIYKKLKGNKGTTVYYPAVVPGSFVEDPTHPDPITRAFTLQVEINQALRVSQRHLREFFPGDYSPIRTYRPISDLLKDALQAITKDLDRLGTEPAASPDAPEALKQLRGDLSIGIDRLSAEKPTTDQGVRSLAQLKQSLEIFQSSLNSGAFGTELLRAKDSVDKITGLKQAVDGLVSALSTTFSVAQAAPTTTSSIPPVSPGGDPLAVVLWRGWSYQSLLVWAPVEKCRALPVEKCRDAPVELCTVWEGEEHLFGVGG